MREPFSKDEIDPTVATVLFLRIADLYMALYMVFDFQEVWTLSESGALV